jgi:hypothetical protein
VADGRSATSAESAPRDATATTSSKGKSFVADPVSISSPTRSSQQAPRAPSKASNSASSSRQPPQTSITSRRPVQSSASGGSTLGLSTSGISRTKPVPLSAGSAGYSSGHYPISPRTQRSNQSTPDPHPHPTPPPPPASALAVYQVAHRYAMPALAALALEHLMVTLTPSSSFSVAKLFHFQNTPQLIFLCSCYLLLQYGMTCIPLSK